MKTIFKDIELDIFLVSKEIIKSLLSSNDSSIRKIISEEELNSLENYHTTAKYVILSSSVYLEEFNSILTYTPVGYYKSFLDLIKNNGYVDSELEVVRKLTELGYEVTPKPQARFDKNVHHDLLVNGKVVVEVSSESDDKSYDVRRSVANFGGYSFVNVDSDISSEDLKTKIEKALAEYEIFNRNMEEFKEILESVSNSEPFKLFDSNLIRFKPLEEFDFSTDNQCLAIFDDDEILQSLSKVKNLKIHKWKQGHLDDYSDVESILLLDKLQMHQSRVVDARQEMNNCEVSIEKLMISELLFILRRTRVRRGEPIKVYVSQEVADYCLQAQLYFGCSLEVLDPKLFYVYYKDHLRKNFFEDLASAVLAGKLVSLDRMEFESNSDLFDTIPRSKRETSRYTALFQGIKEVGISVYIAGELVN